MWQAGIGGYFKNNHWQVCIHEILMSLLMLSLPFYVPAPRNIIWVLIGANALLAIIFQKTFRDFFWKSKKVFLLLSGFFLWHFVGLLYTENISWAWFLIGLLVPLWAVPLAMLTFPLRQATLRWYLRVFVGAMFLYVLITYFWAFYRAFRAWNVPEFAWSDFFYYENFANLRLPPTYYGILVCLATLFLVIDLFFPKKLMLSPSKPLKISLLAIFMLTLMLLATRMQLFILLLGTLILAFEYFRVIKKIWWGIGTGLVVLMTFVVFIFLNPYTQKRFQLLFDESELLVLNKNQDVSTGRNWDGATLRLAKWKCALELIQRNWLWGVGTGDGQDELQAIYEEYKFYFASRYNRYNAHNQFLEIWVALGVIGLILWLGVLSLGLSKALKTSNYVLLATVLVLFFSAITESLLQRNLGVLIIAIFYGIGLAWQKNQEADTKRPASTIS